MKSKAVIAQEIRTRRREAGLCVGCGDVPPLEDRTLCVGCADKQADANKRAREKKIRLGLCIVCGDPAVSGLQKCQSCSDRISSGIRAVRDELQADGVCPYCKVNALSVTPSGKIRKRCDGCLKKSKVKAAREYRDRVSAGVCVYCTTEKAAEGRIYCSGCHLRVLEGRYGKYGFQAWHVEVYGKACNICEQPFDADTVFNVDHCHESNSFRGLLCGACNSGLGRFKDNPDILLKAVRYLNQRKPSLRLVTTAAQGVDALSA